MSELPFEVVCVSKTSTSASPNAIWLSTFCTSYPSVAVVRHHDRGHLEKEGFLLAYGSSGMRVHPQYSKEAWHQAERQEGLGVCTTQETESKQDTA